MKCPHCDTVLDQTPGQELICPSCAAHLGAAPATPVGPPPIVQTEPNAHNRRFASDRISGMTKEQAKTLTQIAATILLVVAANLALNLYDRAQSSFSPSQGENAEYLVVRHTSTMADIDDSWGTRAIQSVINDYVTQGWEFVHMQADGLGAVLIFRRE